MITPELKDRLAKIQELIRRGATDGEKAAAQKAFERLVAKYNLDDSDVNTLTLKRYRFKYTSRLELQLFTRLLERMIGKTDISDVHRATLGCRAIVCELNYCDWVTMDASYEYFRRHMMAQWRKLCLAEINKKRKAKTKNARREKLQDVFYTQYIIKSKLIDEKYLTQVSIEDMSEQEIKDRMALSDVEGGQYNRQMTNGYLLN